MENRCNFLEEGFKIFITLDVQFNFKYLNNFSPWLRQIVFGLKRFPSALNGISNNPRTVSLTANMNFYRKKNIILPFEQLN